VRFCGATAVFWSRRRKGSRGLGALSFTRRIRKLKTSDSGYDIFVVFCNFESFEKP
jgi:hypothetical protein